MPLLRFVVSSDEPELLPSKHLVRADVVDVAGIEQAVADKTGIPRTSFVLEYLHPEVKEHLALTDASDFSELGGGESAVQLRMRRQERSQAETR